MDPQPRWSPEWLLQRSAETVVPPKQADRAQISVPLTVAAEVALCDGRMLRVSGVCTHAAVFVVTPVF